MPLLPSHTLLQTYTLSLIGSAYFLLVNPLALLNAGPLWLLGESMHIRRASYVPSIPTLGAETSSSAPGATLHRKRSIVESILGGPATLSDEIREVLALLALALFVVAVTQGILAAPLRYSKDALVALAQKGRRSKHGAYSDVNAASEFAEKIHTLHTSQTMFLTLAGLRVMIEGALVAAIYLLYSDRTRASGTIGKLNTGIEGEKEYEGVFGLLANRIVFTLALGDMLFWGYFYTVVRDEVREVAEVLAMRRNMEEKDGE